MRAGFTVVELLLALLVLQVGVLATAGLVYLAQQNLHGAEETLRSLAEVQWLGDSLRTRGASGSGMKRYDWGEVLWTSSPLAAGAWDVAAISARTGDTIVFLPGLPDLTPRALTDTCALGGPVRVESP